MNSRARQAGVVLAVTLFMLALLTIIGISAVMMSTTHFRLVGNLQSEKEVEMAMQMAVEDFISVPKSGHPDAFDPPIGAPTSTLSVNGRPVQVTISQPRCVGYVESTCSGTTCSTHWEFQAIATDTVTGTCQAYRWGISAPMPPQLCNSSGTTNATPCP